MKVSVIQYQPVFGNEQASIAALGPLLNKAAGSDLVVLPELAATGYNFENREQAMRFAAEPEKSDFVKVLKSFCNTTGGIVVTGFNELSGNKIYNSALLIDKNGIRNKYRKIQLFMREKEYFEAGDLQPEVIDVGGIKIGMLICFDWMFPELWRKLALQGADVICHPSNLVLPGKAQKAIPVHAMINRIFVITANRTGIEKDLTFTGNSIMAAPSGKVIAEASALRQEVITAEIDISQARDKMITPLNHAYNDRRPEFY
ncbi:MAG: nitrilase-related carbon-nitrogen hydrolase [Bacteroidales bacterium]